MSDSGTQTGRPWRSCLALSVAFSAMARAHPHDSTWRAFYVALAIFWVVPAVYHLAAELVEDIRG